MNRILITLAFIILYSVILNAQSENVGIGTTNPTSKLHVQDGNVKIMNATRPWMIFDHPAGTLNGGLHWWQDGVVEMELFYDDINESLRFWDTPSGVPRIILSRSGNLGIGQATPTAKLHVQNGSALFTGILNTSSPGLPPVEGAGTRMMWYDDKAAFRAGHLQVGAATFWNKDNIGDYSFAVGRSTKAQGSNSSAFGQGTDASGYSSTAMGEYTTASGFYSTAFGQETDASGYSSTAMGQYTTAEAYASVVMGYHNVGGGNPIQWVGTDPIFEIGIGTGDLNRSNAMTVYKNAGALWEGTYDNTSPDAPPTEGAGTRMMWYPAKAAFRAGHLQVGAATFWNKDNIGDYSFAVGINTQAKGSNSTAFGFSTNASGFSSTAMGEYTNASGLGSTALGRESTASGFYSTATGEGSTASGHYSTAMGYTTTASGQSSMAMGEFTDAEANASVAMGRYNVGGGNPTSWVGTDPIFEIGIGTSSIPANAMTVIKNGTIKVDQQIRAMGTGGLELATDEGTIRMKIADNGNVGIGTTAPGSHRLYVTSSGSGSAGSTGFFRNSLSSGIAMSIQNSSSLSSDNALLVANYGSSGDIASFDSWQGTNSWNRRFRFTNSGNGRCDGAWIGGGADYAEYFPKVDPEKNYEPGDVIAMSENIGYAVETAVSSKSNLVIGVYSTNPLIVGNSSADSDPEDAVLVGLMGVIPTKVCLENGPIQIGDFITASSTAGVATKALTSGMVIGRAMENYNTNTPGLIKVFVNVDWVHMEENKTLQEKNEALTSALQDLLSRVEDLEATRKQ